MQEAPVNIESVSIRTMPYSSYGNGYTRITIKTVSSINLLGKNRVYVPTEKKEVKSIAEKAPKKQTAEKKYSDFQQVDEFFLIFY